MRDAPGTTYVRSDQRCMKFTEQAVLNAPIDQVDLQQWMFFRSDAEYQQSARGHRAAGTFVDNGVRGVINFESGYASLPGDGCCLWRAERSGHYAIEAPNGPGGPESLDSSLDSRRLGTEGVRRLPAVLSAGSYSSDCGIEATPTSRSPQAPAAQGDRVEASRGFVINGRYPAGG
jgi:hypothetical protein